MTDPDIEAACDDITKGLKTHRGCSPDIPDLRPCPFCGEQPVTERTGFSGRALYVYCINDNGCPRPKAIGETVEKAAENWNLRFGGVAQPPQDRQVALDSDGKPVYFSQAQPRLSAEDMDALESLARCMGFGRSFHALSRALEIIKGEASSVPSTPRATPQENK